MIEWGLPHLVKDWLDAIPQDQTRFRGPVDAIRCPGGARGVGIILVSAVEEVDSPERPFKERCRPQRPEDLRLGRRGEKVAHCLGKLQSQCYEVMSRKHTRRDVCV